VTGSTLDRAWAFTGLAQQTGAAGDFIKGIALQKKALALKPDMLLAYENLAAFYGSLAWDEQSLAMLNKAIALAASGRDTMMNADFFAVNPLQDRSNRDLLISDYQSVLALDRQLLAAPDRQTWHVAYQNDLDACGSLHDPACVADRWAAMPPAADELDRLGNRSALQVAYADLGMWDKVLEIEPEITKGLSGAGELGRFFMRHLENPLAALAHAGTGDFVTANRLAADTPLDCAKCLMVRGRVAAMAHDWDIADAWYRRAVAAAPSIPLIHSDWGQMLLARGDTEGAIAKFRIANSKSPRYADPLVYWGEALMRQDRSDLALAKFAEAARTAPNWGRLHLKWGRALHYTGRNEEAQKQFAIATGLYLTAAEKAELAAARR
jgi:tetratricopeptide (TPR) repeat protein